MAAWQPFAPRIHDGGHDDDDVGAGERNAIAIVTHVVILLIWRFSVVAIF